MDLLKKMSWIKQARHWQDQLLSCLPFIDKQRLLKRIQSSFNHCLLCRQACQHHLMICPTCLNDLPKFDHKQLQNNFLHWPAFDRLFSQRYFDQLHSYAPYLPPYDQLLKQFKYQSKFELASLLAYFVSQPWQKIDRDHTQTKPLVLSVPIHLNKWQTRGYNQAHLIAKAFAKSNQLIYQKDVLVRVKPTVSQVGQSGVARRKNLKNAFKLTKTIDAKYKQVVLIDDVITTGATVNEISRLLKNNGVEKISVITVAIALPTSLPK